MGLFSDPAPPMTLETYREGMIWLIKLPVP